MWCRLHTIFTARVRGLRSRRSGLSWWGAWKQSSDKLKFLEVGTTYLFLQKYAFTIIILYKRSYNKTVRVRTRFRVFMLFYVFSPVCEISKSDYWLRHVCLSVCLSVRMEPLGSQLDGFSLNFEFDNFLKKSMEYF